MAKKTTIKPIALGYREVGSGDEYTPLMGVLKGLTLSQDEPDSTEIEAEFYDSPFDIFYEGNPLTMSFELTNYDLEELPPLFGGSLDAEEDYEGNPVAYTSEWEWRLEFSRGFAALVIARGLTEGTIKKDADGALNFSVTITALIYRDTSVSPAKDVMYKIVAEIPPTFTNTVKINTSERTVQDGGVYTTQTPLADLYLYGDHLLNASPYIEKVGVPDNPIHPASQNRGVVHFYIENSISESGDEFEVYKDADDDTPWFKIANQ